ncbi:hypothetical protein [Amycolatopsis japonica]
MRIEVAVLLEAIDIANPARHANSRRVVRADLGRVGDDDVDLPMLRRGRRCWLQVQALEASSADACPISSL